MEKEKKATERFRTFWDTNYLTIITCGVVGLVCCIYAGSLLNKTMTPSEGWYSYYASLINEKGAVPYLDFELLFPPLYVYLIALFTKIFGYSIIALRIFGVIIYSSTGIFACLIFQKLFKKNVLGLIGGLLAISFLQREIAQIFYDYIRLMDLNVYISIYFFLRFFDKNRDERGKVTSKKIEMNILLGTVFAVFASMYKQSSGLIFLLFCFAAFLFLSIFLPDHKELLKNLLLMFAVTVIMYGIMFLFLVYKGAFGAYWRYNFHASVDAKGGGSILTLLFGWIPRSKQMIFVNLPIALLALGIILFECWLSRKKFHDKENVRFDRVSIIVISCLMLLSVLACILSRAYSVNLGKLERGGPKYTAFFFSTLIFIISSFLLIFYKKVQIKNFSFCYKYFFVSGAAFVLAYAVCSSGGLGESQASLCMALLITSFAGFARFPKREVITVMISLFMMVNASVSFAVKTVTTYSWWGLNTGNYWEQTTECDIPIFKGIKMSEKYAQMYNNVYYEVLNNSQAGDEIFVFPHMPILYLATGREQATFTAVQWFDVSTDANVIADIDILKEKQPKIMILCFISDYVRQSHEDIFRNGEKSGLTIMQEFLMEFVSEKDYTLLSSDTISEGYEVQVFLSPNTN